MPFLTEMRNRRNALGEPLARIELATYALPRRRYTPKPQWQYPCESKLWFNRYASVGLPLKRRFTFSEP